MRYLNYGPIITLTSVVLAVLLPLAAKSQRSVANVREESTTCLNINLQDANIAVRYRAIRVIQDRGTRQRWLLLQDMKHPAAPARLFPESSEFSCARLPLKASESYSRVNIQNVLIPVIHAGDSLILSEHTSVFDAELAAIALKAAAIGEGLTVRLKFGGRTLGAVATAPGHATVSEEESEVCR